MLAARIEGGILEDRIKVGEIGQLRPVDRHHHIGLDHALEIVVGRADHIIARIAGLELGEQFVIVGEEIHLHLNAGGLLEIGERRLADISIPIVEVELLLLFRQRMRGRKVRPTPRAPRPFRQRTALGEKILDNRLA